MTIHDLQYRIKIKQKDARSRPNYAKTKWEWRSLSFNFGNPSHRRWNSKFAAFWHLRLSELTGFLPTLCGRKWNVLQQCILYSVQVQSVMYRSQNQDVHDYGSWNSFLDTSGEDVTANCKSWECVDTTNPSLQEEIQQFISRSPRGPIRLESQECSAFCPDS